ncbi:hypothetical protein KAR91_04900 [Candidatus Pacearchaeota archaeon]|nr:hypothetical protein [Candidatus Pacearchaeota archaeon]
MKKYGRWIVFGLVAIGLIVLLLLVGVNKNLRQKIKALLLERLVKNKVNDLNEEAAVAKSKAESGKISAEEAENVAKEKEEAISKQKENLQKKLETKGMSADEIANRFNNLRI